MAEEVGTAHVIGWVNFDSSHDSGPELVTQSLRFFEDYWP